jgi:hypothetical protein
MKPHIDGLRARDMAATAIALPTSKADKAVGAYRDQVDDIAGAVIGGHSFGGRVASLLAAEATPIGLVLLSYPLHRPGRPDDLRIEHWPAIRCPVLLLSGEADPFAKVELLRSSIQRLADAELVTYPRQRHGLTAVLDDVLDRVRAFAGSLT